MPQDRAGVGRGKPVQGLPKELVRGRVEQLELSHASGLELDQHRAAVDGVSGPGDPSFVEKAGQHSGQGGRVNAGTRGQLLRVEAAIVDDHVKDVQVARVQPGGLSDLVSENAQFNAQVLQPALQSLRPDAATSRAAPLVGAHAAQRTGLVLVRPAPAPTSPARSRT